MKLDIKSATQFFLFIVVSLVIVFYIFAKGVNIIILPEEASLDANIELKEGFGLALSNRFIFSPGEKKVLIHSPGFYDQELNFLVDSSSNIYTVELKKLPGKVKFNFSPSVVSKIYIDEKLIDPNEDVFSITAGEHLVEAKHPLYLPFSSLIEVVGLDQEQEFSFKLKPNWGSAVFSSSPNGVEVHLSENYLGNTPLTKDIVAGLHEIIYKKEGYEDLVKLVRIEVGKDRILDAVELDLLSAQVFITSKPEKAKVFIDYNFKGFTPINVSLVPNANHAITLELDGYLSSKKLVNLPSNNKSKLKVNLEPVLGKVLIESNLTASIYIDDLLLSKSPYTGYLHAINQKLEVKKKGYRAYSTTINPSKEFETMVSALLITEEKARLAESPKEFTTKGKNQMTLLQPGLIEMGARRSQPGQRANETIRKVQLTKPFYLSIHEVTNSQFSLYKENDSQHNKVTEGNLPVVNVSWNEAALYCNWLSLKEGLSFFYKVNNNQVVGFNLGSEGYRMPTESEWSWSARRINSKKVQYLLFPWGSEMPVAKDSGNYADESAKATSSSYIPNYNDGFSERAPVGSFNPNDKGIYDLGGNVSEFVNDFYSIMTDSKITYNDLIGPAKGRGHVVKGSNWNSSSLTELRYSYRDESLAGDKRTGFRIARWLIGKSDEDD